MKFLGYYKESHCAAGHQWANVLAVWYSPGDSNTGYFCYTAVGQHSECARRYFESLPKLTLEQAREIDPKTVREVESLYPDHCGKETI